MQKNAGRKKFHCRTRDKEKTKDGLSVHSSSVLLGRGGKRTRLSGDLRSALPLKAASSGSEGEEKKPFLR